VGQGLLEQVAVLEAVADPLFEFVGAKRQG